MAVFVITMTTLWACQSGSQPAENNSAVRVKVEKIDKSDESGMLEYVGIIGEKSSAALGFPTLGTLEKIYVEEGDFVSKGQLLAKLDLTSAQGMADGAEATLKQAQDAYTRLKSIHDKGSLPEIQMVEIETKLQQAQSSYNIAKKNLQNCYLYAPSAGVIGKITSQDGENAIIGKSVLTLLDISSVKIKISVPENEISLIPAECRSRITISALGGRNFESQGIEKSVSANVVSHTYPANIPLPNPKRELLPGMVCKVEISTGGSPGELRVPINVVQTMADGRKFVWADNKGTAARIFITTGSAKGNDVIVTSGLATGDRIITEGYQKVSEGEKIEVK